MIAKLKQYKNLILLATAIVLLVALIAADPLGFCAQRAHDRAAICNQMAIEKAEAEQQIAIIKARTEYELKRIEQGLEVTDGQPVDVDTDQADAETNTPAGEQP